MLSTRLGSKTLNTSSLGLGEPQFKTRLQAAPARTLVHTPARYPQAWRTWTFPSPQSQWWQYIGIKSFAHTPGASGLISM